jgi:hypothetical protein
LLSLTVCLLAEAVTPHLLKTLGSKIADSHVEQLLPFLAIRGFLI